MRDHQDVSDSESAFLASEYAVRWSFSLTSVVITVDALLFLSQSHCSWKKFHMRIIEVEMILSNARRDKLFREEIYSCIRIIAKTIEDL